MSDRVVLSALAALLVTGAAGCGSSSSSSSSESSDYCTAARAVRDFQTRFASFNPDSGLAQLKSLLADLTPKVHAADAAAPGDVAASWHTIVRAMDQVNAAVQGSNDLVSAAGALQNLNGTEADAAGKQIDTFTKSTCGFAISTPTPGVPSRG